MRILVVEDSAVVRRKVAEILEGAGHKCAQAENGLEALKLALGGEFGLILSDINMPVLDGLKFIRRIRSSARCAEVPVFILSSQRDEQSVLQARELRVQGYLLKPVNPEDLLGRVKSVEGGRP